MTLPVIANTYRCDLAWGPGDNSTNPPESHNVLHVRGTFGSEQDICDAIVSAMGAIPTVIVCLPPSFSLLRIEIIKLDGSSATQTTIPGSTVTGTGGSEYISQGCLVASWHTAQRGPRGRGRTYFGPISENAQSGGSGAWSGPAVASDLMDFVSSLAGDGAELVVASYVHAEAHTVTSATNDGALRTQRRRQTL